MSANRVEIDEQDFHSQGNVSQFPELAALYVGVLACLMHFQLPNGKHLRTQVEGAPRYQAVVEHAGRRYVRQDVKEDSVWGRKAREGAQIVWVIRKVDNVPLGRIEDNTVWVR